jgi:hypothetical protein
MFTNDIRRKNPNRRYRIGQQVPAIALVTKFDSMLSTSVILLPLFNIDVADFTLDVFTCVSVHKVCDRFDPDEYATGYIFTDSGGNKIYNQYPHTTSCKMVSNDDDYIFKRHCVTDDGETEYVETYIDLTCFLSTLFTSIRCMKARCKYQKTDKDRYESIITSRLTLFRSIMSRYKESTNNTIRFRRLNQRDSINNCWEAYIVNQNC